MTLPVTESVRVADLPAGRCGFVEETEFWGRGAGFGVSGDALASPVSATGFAGLVEHHRDGRFTVDGDALEVCDHTVVRAY